MLALNKFQRSLADPSLNLPSSDDEGDGEQAFGLDQGAQDTNNIVNGVQQKLFKM